MELTSKEKVLSAFRDMGTRRAREIRAGAANGELDGTGIIAAEDFIPQFDPGADYTGVPAGSPVYDAGQVWTLLQPHKPSNYNEQHPGEFRALWGLAHTCDPARAKPFVAPLGTSGLYQSGECCVFAGQVWRCQAANNVYSPAEYPANWEAVA
jgi:hypothetical protein